MHGLARSAVVAVLSLLLPVVAVASPAEASTSSVRASELPGLLVQAPETTTPSYDRSRFEHWTDADGDGCNTRYEVLIQESTTPVTIGSGCSLSGGTWVSPYDGMTAVTPSGIEIDHVVALAEAWRSGASAWTDDMRRAFANDLDVEYALTAASTVSNQSKSDKDPARWLPTNTSYLCEYVTSWALVKYRWSLTVDPAEQGALSRLLSGECGDRVVPLPAVMIGSTSYSFTDVGPASPFSAEIQWLAQRGVSTGWDDGTFRPFQPVTRDAMAAFMYRLAGRPAFDLPAESPFADVPTTYQFYREIAWLARSGISTGWATASGTEFRPWSLITRDAMAAFLYRYAGSPAYTPDGSSPFRDVTSTSPFALEIRWSAARGISTGWDVGYGCRDFAPFATVARDAMAAFMYRSTMGGTAPVTGGTCAPPPSPLHPGAVSAGAFCAKEYSGWYGYTSAGTVMRCTVTASDSRLRWRAV